MCSERAQWEQEFVLEQVYRMNGLEPPNCYCGGVATCDSAGLVSRLDLHNMGLRLLPSALGNLTALTRLVLFVNQIETLPDSLRQLTQLSELYVYENRLRRLPDL